MFFSALYARSYSDMIYHKTVDYAFIAINVNKMKIIHIAKLVQLAEYVFEKLAMTDYAITCSQSRFGHFKQHVKLKFIDNEIFA